MTTESVVPTPAPTTHRRRNAVLALGGLAAAGLVLSVLGIGTGDGPLGPPGGYGTSVSRDVGSEFTEGSTTLVNHGWFAAHIESIRPLPVDDATQGLAITDVQLAPASGPLIGLVDGSGEEYVSDGVRSPAAGYTLLGSRRFDGAGSRAEVLVRARVTHPGAWTYRGYEVTYRSGLVRHHMVVDVELQACTPSGRDCPTPAE